MNGAGFAASVHPANHGLGVTPVPRTPTFIPAYLREAADPMRTFADLAALCRHVQRLRGRAGLSLQPSTGCFPGSRTFPVFEVYRLVDDAPEYLGCAAVQSLTQRAFEEALRAAEAHPESRDPTRHQPERMLVL